MGDSRIWLIRAEASELRVLEHNALGRPVPDPTWFTADAVDAEPEPGDLLVLWRYGRGGESGAVALGSVVDVDDRLLRRAHHDVEEPGMALRRSVLMKFDEAFFRAPVRPADLRYDVRFDASELLAGGAEHLRNPLPLTEGQWNAIAERAPAWADKDYPASPYEVLVEINWTVDRPLGPLEQFREAIQSGDMSPLRIEARGPAAAEGPREVFVRFPDTAGFDPENRLVVWEAVVEARTAEEAARIGYARLQDQARSLGRDDVSVVNY